MQPNVAYVKRAGTQGTILSDSTVVVDELSSDVHILDLPGTAVWTQIDGHRSVAQICDQIVAEFNLDPGTARSDVPAMLNQLLELGLISPANSDPTSKPVADQAQTTASGASPRGSGPPFVLEPPHP